jgi:hypothetical protein
MKNRMYLTGAVALLSLLGALAQAQATQEDLSSRLNFINGKYQDGCLSIEISEFSKRGQYIATTSVASECQADTVTGTYSLRLMDDQGPFATFRSFNSARVTGSLDLHEATIQFIPLTTGVFMNVTYDDGRPPQTLRKQRSSFAIKCSGGVGVDGLVEIDLNEITHKSRLEAYDGVYKVTFNGLPLEAPTTAINLRSVLSKRRILRSADGLITLTRIFPSVSEPGQVIFEVKSENPEFPSVRQLVCEGMTR